MNQPDQDRHTPNADVDPERAQLAQATRALIDAMMTTPQASPEVLATAAAAVEHITQAFASACDHTPEKSTAVSSHGDYLPRSPALGTASPIAPGTIVWQVEADPERSGMTRFVGHGPIGAAYEGPPGYVHGGVIALVFDEVLGVINIANGCPGMTGTLEIRYRRPTPLFTPLRWVAWVERVSGRRVLAKAQVWNDTTLCAEAKGIFIQPNPDRQREYFGVREPTPDQ